jgi:hypothetical protein
MRRLWCLMSLILIVMATRQLELTPPAPDALSITAEPRLQGIYPAGSFIKDDKALGGSGPCDNWPKDLGAKTWGKKQVITGPVLHFGLGANARTAVTRIQWPNGRFCLGRNLVLTLLHPFVIGAQQSEACYREQRSWKRPSWPGRGSSPRPRELSKTIRNVPSGNH